MDPLMGVIFGDLQRSDVEAVVDLSKLSRQFPHGREKWCSSVLHKSDGASSAAADARKYSIKFGSIDAVGSVEPDAQPRTKIWITAPGQQGQQTGGAGASTAGVSFGGNDMPMSPRSVTSVGSGATGAAARTLSPARAPSPARSQTATSANGEAGKAPAGAAEGQPAPAPAVPKGPPKSWADLLRSDGGAASGGAKPVPKKKDTALASESFFRAYSPSFSNIRLQPRGLVNNGNMCFMNAILQPLVHCNAFYNLFKTLRTEVAHNLKISTPLVDAMTEFLLEFQEAPPPEVGDEEDIKDPFEPDGVYDALRALKKISSIKTEIMESPITRIFGGRMRSIIRRAGSKDSVMVEPFQSLQLDIAHDNVNTIEDALSKLTLPEHLDGLSNQQGGIVEATKQNLLDELPPVLILHLKRFVYNSIGGTQKIRKHVVYSPTLKIKPELLSANAKPRFNASEYHLFAVVYHHGKHAAGGHYTCDVSPRTGEWYSINDGIITSIRIEDVVIEHTEKQAYMLFFMRR
ncbi:hypothetical protein HDU96_008323 [Phlyctochytrium bullatum]|nr:hypothetical protein HDU96_008323 [Phlyctochytrium bullatum]